LNLYPSHAFPPFTPHSLIEKKKVRKEGRKEGRKKDNEIRIQEPKNLDSTKYFISVAQSNLYIKGQELEAEKFREKTRLQQLLGSTAPSSVSPLEKTRLRIQSFRSSGITFGGSTRHC
jgi:hypothetical protein